ncbi:hypothetical protein TorRG33x02_135660 [Trema orientale]|uniref:Uncharacterized protein n=1 Tax=Trema orientale TaxID=63057 RepID=A0A2P5EYV2_TREOI|nr:hypothetical protein TorRG33x02_135660 [Trema orientale]
MTKESRDQALLLRFDFTQEQLNGVRGFMAAGVHNSIGDLGVFDL